MADIHIGIDPGKSGGIAVLERGVPVDHIKLSETPHDVARFLRSCADSGESCFAMIEQVGIRSKQRGQSKFLRGAGILEGILITIPISYDWTSPQKWQTYMKCKTGGDKNISKAAAQRLWPDIEMTHAIADAYLIAEYGRRTYKD